MRRPQSFAEVCELWTITELADVTHARYDTVSHWWQRNFIPARNWQAIIGTRRAKEAGVTPELLADLAQQRRLRRRIKMSKPTDERPVHVLIHARMPGRLVQAFLQHIRDFDMQHHADVHFQINAFASQHTVQEIEQLLHSVDPPFTGGVRVEAKQ